VKFHEDSTISPIITNFRIAEIVGHDGKSLSDSPGGDYAYLAPEILNAFNTKTVNFRSLIDYSKQPSWEIGILSYEISCGFHPFVNYPIGFPPVPNLAVPAIDTKPIVKVNLYPKEFATLVAAMLNSNPTERLDLPSAVKQLDRMMDD